MTNTISLSDYQYEERSYCIKGEDKKILCWVKARYALNATSEASKPFAGVVLSEISISTFNHTVRFSPDGAKAICDLVMHLVEDQRSKLPEGVE